MTKITLEVAQKIKILFDSKIFIIDDGRIYKRVTDVFYIRYCGKDYEFKTANVLKYLNGEYVSFVRMKTAEVYEFIKSKMYTKEILLFNNYIYKYYGSKHERGYIFFNITIDGKLYRSFAHRIIYFLNTGIWDNTYIIHHKDSNKSNNNFKNLELTTQFENILYSIKSEELPIIDEDTPRLLKEKYSLNEEQYKQVYSAVNNVLEKYKTKNIF